MEDVRYKLEVFEGPMDLLLRLIAKKKVRVEDVPIMEIIEQYLAYVSRTREENLELSSEFLETAARLLYIKTVSLLPTPEEAEKLVEELRGELTEYRDCKITAEKLKNRADGFDLYARPPEKIEADPVYSRICEPSEILNAYSAALGKGKKRLPPPIEAFEAILSRKIISAASRIKFITERFKNSKKRKMFSFFEDSKSRSELVATFLALLAMIRAGRIRVDGDGDDAEVTLLKRKGRKIEIDE